MGGGGYNAAKVLILAGDYQRYFTLNVRSLVELVLNPPIALTLVKVVPVLKKYYTE